MCSDELVVPAVVFLGHEVLDDEDERPEGVLLVHKQQQDGDDPVKALAVLNVRIMYTAKKEGKIPQNETLKISLGKLAAK